MAGRLAWPARNRLTRTEDRTPAGADARDSTANTPHELVRYIAIGIARLERPSGSGFGHGRTSPTTATRSDRSPIPRAIGPGTP
jgi:hypothetical protein